MLAAGTSLGPYKILALLGAGGMGEVYRAHDTRLGRDVAIKVLSPHLAATPEVRARFEREARTISQLNHPHICTLFDIGYQDGTDFLVMELLEGETLAHRLEKGPLPVTEVLALGTQIADALDRAHRAGVVHRDLKPGNVMLTKAGAKLMDFGLARAAGLAAAAPGALTESPTVSRPLTAEGTIVGTFQYMAPEQLEGKEADARSDLWALGCVFYEMATGRRAFEGASQASLIAAIVKDEPLAISELQPLTPPALQRLVRQCLAKDPDKRWQSAGDIARELEWIAGEGSSAEATGVIRREPSRGPRLWLRLVVPLVLAAVVGTAAFIAGSRHQRLMAPGVAKFRQVTYGPQTIFNARFSPDGNTIFFSRALVGTVPEVSEIRAQYPEPHTLGLRDVHLLSVSSRGEMAVLTDAKFEGAHRIFTGTLSTLTIGSQAPRALLEDVREADWSPDGTRLAIIHKVAGVDRLEFPIGTVLYQAPGYLSDLRVSPAGDRIAFFQHPLRWDDRGDVVVVDLAGRHSILAQGFESLEGLAWDGGERVLFAGRAAGTGSYSVLAATLGKKLSVVLPSLSRLTFYDARPDGRWLLAREDKRTEIWVRAPGAKEERDLSWLDFGDHPMLSPDGRTLLFTEQGDVAGPSYAVCQRRTEGSPVLRLGDGRSCGLSPEGKWALALIHSSPPKIMLYPTGPGAPRQLDRGAFASILGVRWFPDGRKILVSGSQAAGSPRCYALDIAGGKPRPVTPEGTVDGWVSPDGMTILAFDQSARPFLYPLDGGAPRPVPGMTTRERILHWSSGGGSVLVGTLSSVPVRVERLNLTTGARSPVADLAIADRSGALFLYAAAFADDERFYAYTLLRNRSSLYEVQRGR